MPGLGLGIGLPKSRKVGDGFTSPTSQVENGPTVPCETLTAVGNDGFDAANSSASGFCGWSIAGTVGQTVTVSFEITEITTGATWGLRLRSTAIDSAAVDPENMQFSTGETGMYNFTMSEAGAGWAAISFGTGNSSSTLSVRNFRYRING